MTSLDEKRELRARLLQERGAAKIAKKVEGTKVRSATPGAAAEPPLLPIERNRELKLSSEHERIPLSEQLQPESLFCKASGSLKNTDELLTWLPAMSGEGITGQ